MHQQMYRTPAGRPKPDLLTFADQVWAAGTALPQDPTPPSLRMRKVPNRKDRRKATKHGRS